MDIDEYQKRTGSTELSDEQLVEASGRLEQRDVFTAGNAVAMLAQCESIKKRVCYNRPNHVRTGSVDQLAVEGFIDDEANMQAAHIMFGVMGEVGEFVAALASGDRDSIVSEAGDVLYYLSNGLKLSGITVSEALEENEAKRIRRGPIGYSEKVIPRR